MVFRTTARRGKRVKRTRNARGGNKGRRTRNTRRGKNVRRMRKTLRKRNRRVQKGGNMDLYNAVMSRNIAQVNEVLTRVDVNTTLIGGNTALYLASKNGFVDVVNTLLLNEAINIDNRDLFGETAIYTASSNDHVDVVNVLIDAGANINIPDSDGDRPIDIAVEKGFVDVVNALIAAGAEVDTDKLLEISNRKCTRYRRSGDAVKLGIYKGIYNKIKEIADFNARSSMVHLVSNVGAV